MAATTKKAPTKKGPAKTQAEPRKPFAETAAYAYAGVLHDVVEFAREAPKHVPTTPEGMRVQFRENLNSAVTQFNRRLEDKAKEGREAADELRHDPRIERVTDTLQPVLKQATNTRRQVKAAVTSVTKTAGVAGEAAGTQVPDVRSQAKAVVTSISKLADTAIDAGRKQAHTARSQVKAAITSTRKTVDTAVEAGRKLAG